MGTKNYISRGVSMIYRQGNRFCDRKLAEYHIGSGQNYFLTCIYEHQGINMYELAQLGHFDKGTVTKGIQKLEEQGYICTQQKKRLLSWNGFMKSEESGIRF